jgi:hypothetical protein
MDAVTLNSQLTKFYVEVASGKENRCQNQFNQMNNVQNITSNSVPFMVLPSITNYGNITIKYNIRKLPH